MPLYAAELFLMQPHIYVDCVLCRGHSRPSTKEDSMTQTEWIISRMQELDQYRWDGWITEAEYQEKMDYWRAILRGCES
jgi:hypothetical protein